MKNNTALIIIDIQNDYFDGGVNPLSGSMQASLKAKDLLQNFRENNLPIVHIQHIANREGATFFLKGSNGAEIHENVRPKDGEKVIVKHFPNSFRGTQLQEYLQSKGIENLVICGMMTHTCVDSTSRAAKDLGYNVTIIADACATKDLSFEGRVAKAEDVQTSFFGALSYFYANVVTLNQYLSE